MLEARKLYINGEGVFGAALFFVIDNIIYYRAKEFVAGGRIRSFVNFENGMDFFRSGAKIGIENGLAAVLFRDYMFF